VTKNEQYLSNIIAAGLVDEGMEFDELTTRIRQLEDQIQSNKPVCPYCKQSMIPMNYVGYYDSFAHWNCECYELLEGKTHKGCYA
jgi:transposase-like protein